MLFFVLKHCLSSVIWLSNFASVSYAIKWASTNRLIGFSETDQITEGLLCFRMKRQRCKAVRDLTHQAVKTQREWKLHAFNWELRNTKTGAPLHDPSTTATDSCWTGNTNYVMIYITGPRWNKENVLRTTRLYITDHFLNKVSFTYGKNAQIFM
jgi:hypothetical protein